MKKLALLIFQPCNISAIVSPTANIITLIDGCQLNEDCNLLILEELSLARLASIAETSKRFQSLAQQVFRRQFAKRTFIFHTPYFIDANTMTGAELTENTGDGNVKIKHLPSISRILRNFGHLITKLSIINDFTISKSIARKIFHLVNLYCAESLTHFTIKNYWNNVFADVHLPFVRTEFLSLDGSFKSLRSANATLGQMFPMLRFLDLGSTNIDDMNMYDQKMPLLQHLTWNGGKSDALRTIFKNHPHIQSLNLTSADSHLVEMAARELMQLQYLTINNYMTYNANDIEFKHLKSFTLSGYFGTFPTNFLFGGLEELEVVSEQHDSKQTIEFALRNRDTLKKLRLVVSLRDSEILHLANASLSLLEMDIACGLDVQCESLVKLVENSKHLIELTLNVEAEHLRHDVFETLRAGFANKWTVVRGSDSCVRLSRCDEKQA